MMTVPITLLQQREIEAKIVGPIFRAFAEEIGEQRAREILRNVIESLARQSGTQAAERLGGNDLVQLGQLTQTWNQGGALETELLRQDESNLEFNVTRCQFAEMYRRLGLEDLGAILSCNRDGAAIQGFNPEIQFERTQTLMEGASHCDFRYRTAKDSLNQ